MADLTQGNYTTSTASTAVDPYANETPEQKAKRLAAAATPVAMATSYAAPETIVPSASNLANTSTSNIYNYSPVTGSTYGTSALNNMLGQTTPTISSPSRSIEVPTMRSNEALTMPSNWSGWAEIDAKAAAANTATPTTTSTPVVTPVNTLKAAPMGSIGYNSATGSFIFPDQNATAAIEPTQTPAEIAQSTKEYYDLVNAPGPRSVAYGSGYTGEAIPSNLIQKAPKMGSLIVSPQPVAPTQTSTQQAALNNMISQTPTATTTVAPVVPVPSYITPQIQSALDNFLTMQGVTTQEGRNELLPYLYKVNDPNYIPPVSTTPPPTQALIPQVNAPSYLVPYTAPLGNPQGVYGKVNIALPSANINQFINSFTQ